MRTCTSHPIYNFVSYKSLSPGFQPFITKLDEIQIPNTIQEALKVPKWKATISEENCALERNKTWEISNLPARKHPVGCKWIFTVKQKSCGSVDIFKGRLVAKGFTQSYGINIQETFALVAKLNTVRVLLSLAANLDWSLYQLDVKNAFHYGDLQEEVYMEIPPDLQSQAAINKVCRLKKSLYRLKQSPRSMV